MTRTKATPQANMKPVQSPPEAEMSTSKYANIKGAVNLARLRQFKEKERPKLASRAPLLSLWTSFLATSMVVTGPSKVFVDLVCLVIPSTQKY